MLLWSYIALRSHQVNGWSGLQGWRLCRVGPIGSPFNNNNIYKNQQDRSISRRSTNQASTPAILGHKHLNGVNRPEQTARFLANGPHSLATVARNVALLSNMFTVKHLYMHGGEGQIRTHSVGLSEELKSASPEPIDWIETTHFVTIGVNSIHYYPKRSSSVHTRPLAPTRPARTCTSMSLYVLTCTCLPIVSN